MKLSYFQRAENGARVKFQGESYTYTYMNNLLSNLSFRVLSLKRRRSEIRHQHSLTMRFATALTQWCFWWLLSIPRVASLAILKRPIQKISNGGTMSRRDALLLGPAVVTVATLLPRVSHAATSTGEVTTVPELLARLKSVPTFCIVNKDGAAYMIVKADERIAKGYAFTTYQGAKVVLEDAQKTASEKGYGELWEDATITTIPADAAVRLSLTKKERTSQKDQSLDSILSVIPSAVSAHWRRVLL